MLDTSSESSSFGFVIFTIDVTDSIKSLISGNKSVDSEKEINEKQIYKFKLHTFEVYIILSIINFAK